MTKRTVLKRLKSLAVGALITCSSMASAEESAMKKIFVDDDRVECPSAKFSSIQDAVNAASPGTEIRVYPGKYSEQVSITKSVQLIGEEGAVVIPKGMKVNTENLAMYEEMAAILTVKGVTNVLIQGLTFDGRDSGITDCSVELAGVVCEDMSGEIKNVTIRNISSNSSSYSGCESAYGIFAQSSDSSETVLKVNNSRIDDWKSAAIVGNNLGTLVRAKNNKIGGGCRDEASGLKLAFGAIGTSQGNTVAAVR